MSGKSPPLKVLIAGAGIGGLAAAVGLRQQGHEVSMYEKSGFNNEVGAALTVPPNADGLLKRLGLDPNENGGTREEWLTHFTEKGKVVTDVDFGKLRKFFSPNEAGTIHRIDLHEGLRDLALSLGVGIHLRNAVTSVDPEAGSITLEDGTTVTGDVVIGADGIHSKVRRFMFGEDKKPRPFGVTTFRLLIPSSDIAKDPQARKFVERDGLLTVWADEGGRKFITYPCRKNQLLNVVAAFPECIAQPSAEDPNLKETMLDIFSEFSPEVKALISLADKVMLWRLLDIPTLDTWSRGKATLVGDAAHPLQPYSAQGGAQAVEDAATLAVLLGRGTTAAQVSSRLQLFYSCRHERVNFVQAFSRSMGQSTPGNDVEPLMPYDQYNQIVFRHDAWSHAEQTLAYEESKVRWAGLKIMAAGRFVTKGAGIAIALGSEKLAGRGVSLDTRP